MLKRITIQNFAIIGDLEVEFSSGLSVITGETGAGKSIIVDALGLLLGDRADIDQIRYGAEKAVIEGVFYLEKPQNRLLFAEALDQPLSDGELIVRRVVEKTGRMLYRFNGMTLGLNQGKALMRTLVDIHSQHENIALLDKKNHLPLLDHFLPEPTAMVTFAKAYEDFQQALSTQKAFAEQQISADEAEFLAFQVDEMNAVELKPGELATLVQRQKDLQNREKLLQKRALLAHLLQGDQGALTQLYLASKEVVSLDNEDWTSQIKNSYFELSALAQAIDEHLEQLTASEQSLEEIANRIYRIKKVVQKHGGDEAAALLALAKMEEKLRDYQNFQTKNAHYLAKVTATRTSAELAASKLSAQRQTAAHSLSDQINRELKALALAHATFSVQFTASHLSANGMDEVEFFLQANVGSPALALKNAISGGEASRLMLALKLVFTAGSQLETLVFDEVDSGVSGRVASLVGQKIRKLSQDAQVIAITHLPQVASCAHHHYRVEKNIKDGQTYTDIIPLSGAQITAAVASLIAGGAITPATLLAAEELIKAAK